MEVFRIARREIDGMRIVDVSERINVVGKRFFRRELTVLIATIGVTLR